MTIDPKELPVPPLDLLRRAGHLRDQHAQADFLDLGRALRRQIEAILPDDWIWEQGRVLDFGCGAGKVLRQFAAEADAAEFWGCDIHAESIEWIQANMSPPFRAFVCAEEAGLPHPDGYFDLIFALSVYTHITDHWAEWLLEHHRVLTDRGLLLVTFLGEGTVQELTDEPWREDRIGMNVLREGNPWDLGGPTTLLSPWWLRAHWGRAFEIVDLWPYMSVEPRKPTEHEPPMGQGMILLRRKQVRLNVEDLTRLEPNEPRELQALQHNIRQLRREAATLQHNIRQLRGEAAELRRSYAQLVDQVNGEHGELGHRLVEMAEVKQELGARDRELRQAQEDLLAHRAWLDGIQASASWRLTAPLRLAKRRLVNGRRSIRDLTRRPDPVEGSRSTRR